MELRGSNPGLP